MKEEANSRVGQRFAHKPRQQQQLVVLNPYGRLGVGALLYGRQETAVNCLVGRVIPGVEFAISLEIMEERP